MCRERRSNDKYRGNTDRYVLKVLVRRNNGVFISDEFERQFKLVNLCV